MKVPLVCAGLALAVLAFPTASACCHLVYGEGDVGPCGYVWWGNLVFAGLEAQSLDEAHAGCRVGDHSVGVDVVPCTPYVVDWGSCVLP